MWEELFISALDKTSFEGVTGPVRFKGNSRRGNIVIKQIVRKCTPLKTIRIHNATMFQINLFLSRKILVFEYALDIIWVSIEMQDGDRFALI